MGAPSDVLHYCSIIIWGGRPWSRLSLPASLRCPHARAVLPCIRMHLRCTCLAPLIAFFSKQKPIANFE